jgi:cobalt-zinc-cadmium efflux system membrane fusion protein
MTARGAKLLKTTVFVVVAVLGIVVVCAAAVFLKPGKESPASDRESTASVTLKNGDTLAVPQNVVATLGIKTQEAEPAKGRALEVFGQLAPDWSHLIRIKLRFPGKVVRIADIPAPSSFGGETEMRQISVGDEVAKDQILAIVYSTDLGQKKSELVDAVSQLRLDEKILTKYRQVEPSLSPKSVWTQERQVDQDRIAAQKAEGTLLAWEVPDKEIEALKKEAERLQDAGKLRTKADFERWARMEVHAPKDWGGTIVEKNVTIDELIDPQNSPPLFQILDRSRMIVYGYPSEDDLRVLDKLERPLHWTVHLMGDPDGKPLESPTGDPRGPTVEILPNQEPTQRSPILQSFVKNPGGRLLSNMGVVAQVPLDSPVDQVEIPATAVVDDGSQSYVFVQQDPKRTEFTLRAVPVTRRYEKVVYVRGKLTPAEQKQTANSEPALKPLAPGERVVAAGAVELKGAFDDLRSNVQAPAK